MLLGLTDIFAIVKAVFQFPSTILEFVKILGKTPQDKHEDLLKKMREESVKFENTGRPDWS